MIADILINHIKNRILKPYDLNSKLRLSNIRIMFEMSIKSFTFLPFYEIEKRQ